jgi:hypothetical protein
MNHTTHYYTRSIRCGVRRNSRSRGHSSPYGRVHILRSCLSNSKMPGENLACQGLAEEKHRVRPMISGSCSVAGQKGLVPGGILNSKSQILDSFHLHAKVIRRGTITTWDKCDRLCRDSDNSSMAISPNTGTGCQRNQSSALSLGIHMLWWVVVPGPSPWPRSNHSVGVRVVNIPPGTQSVSQS